MKGVQSKVSEKLCKTIRFCLFKHFGSRDEVAMGTARLSLQRAVPSGTAVLPEPSRWDCTEQNSSLVVETVTRTTLTPSFPLKSSFSVDQTLEQLPATVCSLACSAASLWLGTPSWCSRVCPTPGVPCHTLSCR